MKQKTQDQLTALAPPAANGHFVSPDKWMRMGERERIEHLTGRSLDNCKEILDYPIQAALLSPTLMTGKCQVIRAVLNIITKVGLESHRLQHMQDELLGRMISDFADEAQKN